MNLLLQQFNRTSKHCAFAATERCSTSVLLIGVAGRSAAVVKSSRRQKSAWNLLSQLAGTEMGARVSAASHATAPARHLHVDQSSGWTGSQIESAAAREYGAAVKTSLTCSLALNSLNIPGQHSYMAVLDAAVRSVIRGDAAAQDALDGVALEWSRITDGLGKANQLEAYGRSLGIEP